VKAVHASTTQPVEQQTATIKCPIKEFPSVEAFQIRIRGAYRIKTRENRPGWRGQPAAIFKNAERTNLEQVVFAWHRM
jgi:hypothetical protein